VSQTLESEAREAGILPGEWDPVSREPAPEEKPNGKAGANAKAAPQPIVLSIDGGAVAEISAGVKVLVEGQATLVAGQAAMAEGLAAVTAALKAHGTAMETWLKRLDRVMSAPRSVTLKRGEDGFAKSAISEALVPKAKG